MPQAAASPAVRIGFLHRNGLTLAFLALMLLSLAGHALAGWRVDSEERIDHGQPAESLVQYLGHEHFLSTVFENWESEFLQMGLFVLLTAVLRQKGAAESRPLDPAEETPAGPTPVAQRPWPARKGGVWRVAYGHSLSGALLLLFMLSFWAHLYNSWKAHLQELAQHGKTATAGIWEHLGSAQFWFESFQNWQSEFLAVVALVLLSIVLREKDSTESKDVDAPHSQTGA